MPIEYLEERRMFLLTTSQTAYVFGLGEADQLVHSYWGSRLSYSSDYPNVVSNWQYSSFGAHLHELLAELPVASGIAEIEPLIRLSFADGTRALKLIYKGYEISQDELVIRLSDPIYKLELIVYYKVHADCDLISRRIGLVNLSSQPITLEAVASGGVHLPYDQSDYFLTHLGGNWLLEMQPQRTPITLGRKTLEGRLNYTGHAANPFFAFDHNATETTGEVWFGTLAWSGNWKILVEQVAVPYKLIRVSAGLNDYDFSYELQPNQEFVTPLLTLGYTNAGFGQMSRNLHRYVNENILNPNFANTTRPVLYNSWEAVYFNVSEEAQVNLAKKAARLGIELFVVDDGWFGKRDNDVAGLGDWQPNPAKFPNGLKPLIAQVNKLGMDFGIWVEPEMVNPDSDLYRLHPDWVYHFANRESTLSRNQLILNLARPDVQEYTFGWLDRLLAEHNIRYIKWDYNRAISEAGWPAAPLAQQREIWVRHIEALYALVARLRKRHPQVLFEACSGGGGRIDQGILAYFDHFWTSDNTDPVDRLNIQRSFLLAYPAKTMYCWVTQTDLNQGSYALRYRFHSAFMGALGIGANLDHWSEADFEEAKKLIAEYKQIRPIIQHGEVYRLSEAPQPILAIEYLAHDNQAAVILAYSHKTHFWRNPTRLRLQGLLPDQIYELSGDLAPNESQLLSGQALMSYGIMPRLENHFSSALILIKRR